MARKHHNSSEQTAEHPDITAAAVEAMLALIGERGWGAVSLADIGLRAGVSLGQLHEHLGTHPKSALLEAFAAGLDDAVLAGGPPSLDDPIRDRLFDVAMRRFDAMQLHRPAIRALIRQAKRDPFLALCGGVRLSRSAALMLEAAGINAWGPVGRLKAKGLAAVLASATRVWLEDENPDMPKTMATLDKGLRRAEGIALLLCRSHATPKATAGAAGDSEAEAPTA